MPPVPTRRRRARPVADAPIGELLTGVEELAKAWLVELIERAPLRDAAAILAAPLSREGPALCDAALRAITADEPLRRLQRGGALRRLAQRSPQLAGARSALQAAAAIDALHGVLWAALRDRLQDADPLWVAQLSERLALVAEVLREAALEAFETPGGTGRTSPGDGEGAAGNTGPGAGDAFTGPGEPGEAVAARPWPQAPVPSSARAGLWMSALAAEVSRSRPGELALLSVELEDADRLAVSGDGAPVAVVFDHFAAQLRAAVRERDILVRENDGRAWIIAPGTSRSQARELGERIAAAVAQRRWRGAPLAASVGIAVLGEDGETPDRLIEAAEEARFAAAADGVRVSEAPDPRRSR
ncbi:MAG TPA: diguanylate cyclase [Solirubrobacteraceae bacterium]|nr:diguanylate cyclase [Solirubrobacteraceae bacterium]